jgi:hypothetical protein
MTQCDFWDAIQTANSTTMMTNITCTTNTGAAASYDGIKAGFVLATFFVLLRM